MTTYTVSPHAESDIENIVLWIANDNPAAALKMFESFYDAFRLLGDNPHIGHKREDLTNREVLFWTVKPRYHVIYSIQYNPIFIARVLPADMDLAREITNTKF